MALVACYECGKQVSTLAQHCPQCGAPGRPAELNGAAEGTAHPEGGREAIVQPRPVPWYRRSRVNTAFIIIGMGTQGVVPLTLVTCLLLLTGEIYYKTAPGAPQQVWGKANKFAAAFILVANIAWLIYLASVVAWRVDETAATSPVANPVLPAAPRTPIMTDTSLVPARDEVADRLSVSAVKFNAAAPTMVDKETRLDSVSASGRTLTLNYTMVERSSETVTTEQITTGQSRLVRRICDGKLAAWIAQGVTLRMRYSSSDGIEFTTIDVDMSRCDTLRARGERLSN